MSKVYDDIIKVNARVIVVSALRPNDYYYSRIEDIHENSIDIQIPSRSGSPMPIIKNSSLYVSVISNNKRYSFETRIITTVAKKIKMLSIVYPSSIKREQLRQFYRVSVHLHVQIYLGALNVFNVERELRRPLCNNVLIDEISGGGGKLSINKHLTLHSDIILDFSNTETGVNSAQAKIVRILPKRNGKNAFCFEFTDISERERDKIIHYVFKRQRDLRKLAIQTDEKFVGYKYFA